MTKNTFKECVVALFKHLRESLYRVRFRTFNLKPDMEMLKLYIITKIYLIVYYQDIKISVSIFITRVRFRTLHIKPDMKLKLYI